MTLTYKFEDKLYFPITFFKIENTNFIHILVDNEQKQRFFLAINEYSLIDVTETEKQLIDLTGKAKLLTLQEHIEIVKRTGSATKHPM